MVLCLRFMQIKWKCWSWVNWKQQDEPEETLDLVFHCRLSNLGWATWHLWSQFFTCKLGKIMSCFTSITSLSWRSPWDITRQPRNKQRLACAYLPWVRHWSQHLKHINSFNPHSNPWESHYCHIILNLQMRKVRERVTSQGHTVSQQWLQHLKSVMTFNGLWLLSCISQKCTGP